MSPMLIGASLGSFKRLELKQAMKLYLELSNDFNLNAIEIRFEKEIGRPSLWSWETNSELHNLLEKFEVTGVHLPFIYLNPLSFNPRIRDESLAQLRLGIKKASELEVDYCVMHARGFNETLTHVQQLRMWTKVIEELTECAKDNRVLLTIENADSLSNLKDLVNVVRTINSKWLKITYDVGHSHNRDLPPLSSYPVRGIILKLLDFYFPFFISKKYMPYEKYGSIDNFLRKEFDLIYCIHLHDTAGKKDHMTLNAGKINFSFLRVLISEGFAGPFIFEVEITDYKDLEINLKRFKELIGV